MEDDSVLSVRKCAFILNPLVHACAREEFLSWAEIDAGKAAEAQLTSLNWKRHV